MHVLSACLPRTHALFSCPLVLTCLDVHRNARAVDCTGPLRVTYGTDDALVRATQEASETAAALDAQIAFAGSSFPFHMFSSSHLLLCARSKVEKELQEALDTVHMYNDVKDAAQALMGRFGACFSSLLPFLFLWFFT